MSGSILPTGAWDDAGIWSDEGAWDDSGVSSLNPNALTGGAPVASSPALRQRHGLQPNFLAGGAAHFSTVGLRDAPILLNASGIVTGGPSLSFPVIVIASAPPPGPPPIAKPEIIAPGVTGLTSGRMITTAEIEIYTPGVSGVETARRAWGAYPWNTRLRVLGKLERTDTIRVSDIGYRTAPNDSPSVAAFPPYLAEGLAIDRGVQLAPGKSAAGAAWGSLTILNPNRRLNAFVAGNSDARPVKMLTGRKGWDERLGMEVDPPLAQMSELFTGIATPWSLTENSMVIPVRDASYWIERRYQNNTYGGTGGYDGPEELKGRLRPRARGGTTADPIRNARPILIDPLNRIYQYNDGFGTIVKLYEGGDENNIIRDPDVTNLYDGGGPAPGHYRTDNSRGLFQLGSKASREITCDITGRFPVAGAMSTGAGIVRHILTEDMQLPPGLVDITKLDALAASSAAPSGWYWSGDQEVTGIGAIEPFLAGINAKLVPTRSGRLTVMLLKAFSDGTLPSVRRFTDTEIVSMAPRGLGEPLDPPAAIWRAGWGRNNTIQSGSLDPDLSDERKQLLAEEWQSGVWVGTSILAAYRRPSNPPVVPTALLRRADADALAASWGALWGATRRRLYDMEVPAMLTYPIDVGQIITVAYPMDDLDGGRDMLVVGESLQTSRATATLRVLL